MSKIVLNTFGSFGDLHPYLALAIELKKRSHQPVIATSEVYRKKVEAEGIRFAPVRPDIGELMENAEFLKLLWDPKFGTMHLFRDYLLPKVHESYEDLAPLCADADLLITHFAVFAGPALAKDQKLRWLSVALQPTVFFSKYDPPVLAPAPWARHLYGLGSWVFASLLKVGESAGGFKIKDQFSPYRTLALFSRHFAQPQPDWPPNTKTTGFVTYDKPGEGFGLSPNKIELEQFLAAGKAPVVFTLGSSAVMAAEQFFEESIEAATKLGVRAVLLAWKKEQLVKGDSSILVTDYVPYSELFPRAAALVHSGGIGSVGQALRAGRPMLIVPWAHDQPDNAHRCRKLGVADTIERKRYRAGIVARKLKSILADETIAQKAKTIAQNLAAEDGLKTACDVIEANVSS